MNLALFGAGAVAKSFLIRVPGLAARLGPVGAPSFRLASRIVNAMKAGHAVKDMAEFADCRLVLVCVPDRTLPDAVALLADSLVDWSGKIVLLCDSSEDSHALAPIRQRGALVGSLNPVDGPDQRYIVEGDRPAVREAKHLVRDLKGQAIELDSDKMALYMAGQSFGSSLFVPLAAACVECIAAAAGSTPRAMRIAEALFQRWLRAYVHAGKKSWSGPLAWGDADAVLRELQALRRTNPSLERLYREMAVFSLEWSRRHPELLRNLRNGPDARAVIGPAGPRPPANPALPL